MVADRVAEGITHHRLSTDTVDRIGRLEEAFQSGPLIAPGIRTIYDTLHQATKELDGSYEDVLQLTYRLFQGTAMEPLLPEYLWMLNFEPQKDPRFAEELSKPLDYLFINPKNDDTDPLLPLVYNAIQNPRMAAFTSARGFSDLSEAHSVPRMLLHDVGKVVLFSSTQPSHDGDITDIIRALDAILYNPDFAIKIQDLSIVIPMWGGSRNDKPVLMPTPDGIVQLMNPQDRDPKEPPQSRQDAEDIESRINQIRSFVYSYTGVYIPTSVTTVDIHGRILPGDIITLRGHKFHSISTAEVLVPPTEAYLRTSGLENIKRRVNAPDRSALPRSLNVVMELLLSGQDSVELVKVAKFRKEAGRVTHVEIQEIVDCTLNSDGTIKQTLLDKNAPRERRVIYHVDDIGDTMNTIRCNREILDQELPSISDEPDINLLLLSHAILSKGVDVLDQLGMDKIFITDTLQRQDVAEHSLVQLVSVAPLIAKQLMDSN